MSKTNRLLKLRKKLKNKRPKFRRYESWRHKRLGSKWRRARGIDSKVRKKKKGNIRSPNIGYRSPKKVRYLHPSGFEEVIVHNLAELEQTKPRKQVVKIAHSVGRHKRIMMQDRADELNILILNRTRILLPGEELLMESYGAEPELEPFGEEPFGEEPFDEEPFDEEPFGEEEKDDEVTKEIESFEEEPSEEYNQERDED